MEHSVEKNIHVIARLLRSRRVINSSPVNFYNIRIAFPRFSENVTFFPPVIGVGNISFSEISAYVRKG